MPLTLTAADDDDGRRLDRILRKALRDLPLSAIHRLLRQGAVKVNGERAAPDRRVQAGETITIANGPEDISQSSQGYVEKCLTPRREGAKHAKKKRRKNLSRGTRSYTEEQRFSDNNIQIPEILYEGAGLLVLNKHAGIAVHGGGNDGAPSLEDMVLSYLAPKLSPSLSFRPGPLHRLDKPSSGVIVFSTSLEGARIFSTLMRERKIKKFYLALVEGAVKKDEIWMNELVRDRKEKITFIAEREGDSKTALTRVTPIASNSACSLILAEIETGRTHQIRAQAASHAHPLLGDKKYGGRRQNGGFLLHAWRLEIPAGFPAEAQENCPDERRPGAQLPFIIEAPLPEKFIKKIRELFGKDVMENLQTSDTKTYSPQRRGPRRTLTLLNRRRL